MRSHAFRPFGSDSVAVMTGDDTRYEASCLADEVVVDFPSVARAIERIRTAFMEDERPAAVPASLHLTTRDARSGVTLPLDVPVRCTCRRCGGRGETWTESCLQCSGSGTELFRHQLQVTVPAGVIDGDRFQFFVTPRHHPPTRIDLHIRVA